MDKEKILQQLEWIINSPESNNDKLYLICNLLKQEVDYYDWVGFYILDHETQTLHLGPYAGKATEHTCIPVGKGVCGQVAESGESMVVQDVSKMDNYIACSIDVQSEIVVPIMKNGSFIAEIDIDSHAYAPFTDSDNALLEEIATIISPLF